MKRLLNRKPLLVAAVFAMFAAAGMPAASQEVHLDDIWSRPALLDGQGSPKQLLRDRGIQINDSLTQFYQGVVSGDDDNHWQYGGKGDLIATFDAAKLGLWRGLFVSLHQEWVFGEDANNQDDGSLFPLNTTLGFSRLGGFDRDTSIVVTQLFNDANPNKVLSTALGESLENTQLTPHRICVGRRGSLLHLAGICSAAERRHHLFRRLNPDDGRHGAEG